MRALFIAILSLSLLTTASAANAPESYWKDYHKGMKEPVLPPAKLADGDFQFRWTRLADAGEPLSIRVWRSRGQIFVRAVRLQYRYDFRIGRITHQQTTQLTSEQVAPLRAYITAADFWQPFQESEYLLGGAHWLFELQDSSGYRFVSLFSPALLMGDQQSRKSRENIQRFRRYIRAASLLLRTTNIFPDEHEANY